MRLTAQEVYDKLINEDGILQLEGQIKFYLVLANGLSYFNKTSYLQPGFFQFAQPILFVFLLHVKNNF